MKSPSGDSLSMVDANCTAWAEGVSLSAIRWLKVFSSVISLPVAAFRIRIMPSAMISTMVSGSRGVEAITRSLAATASVFTDATALSKVPLLVMGL